MWRWLFDVSRRMAKEYSLIVSTVILVTLLITTMEKVRSRFLG